MGWGAFVACWTIANVLGGKSRELNIGQALPIIAVLYIVAGFMVLAVIFALVALLFSRRALYLAILYLATGIWACYAFDASS